MPLFGQFPDFVNANQYLYQYEKRMIPDDLKADVDFTREVRYLTIEQTMKLLVTETSGESDPRMSRKNVLVTQHTITPSVLALDLSVLYTIESRNHTLSTGISASANCPSADQITIALLKSFWILYDAICKPQTIQYKQDEKETTIEENNIGELKIIISPDQTNPLVFLLIDIYTRYQKLKDIKQLKNSVFYYGELSSLVKGLEKKNKLDEPEVILGRIEAILEFLSDTIRQFYEENDIEINCEAAVSEMPSDNPQHSPRFTSDNEKFIFDITPPLSTTLSTPESSGLSSPTTLSTPESFSPESSLSDLKLPCDGIGAFSTGIENTFFRKIERQNDSTQSSSPTENDTTTLNPQGSAS